MDLSFAVEAEVPELYSILNKIVNLSQSEDMGYALVSYMYRNQKVSFMDFLKDNMIGVILVLFAVFSVIIALLLSEAEGGPEGPQAAAPVGGGRRDRGAEADGHFPDGQYARHELHQGREDRRISGLQPGFRGVCKKGKTGGCDRAHGRGAFRRPDGEAFRGGRTGWRSPWTSRISSSRMYRTRRAASGSSKTPG
jgi:hypothetical protein